MDQKEIKNFIAQKVPEGYSLSKIQDMLKEQGVHITFMELRLLASEIEEQVWKQTEKPEPAPEAAQEIAPEPAAAEAPLEEGSPLPGEGPASPAEPQSAEKPAEPAAPRGKTTVELSKIARPGTAASGTVKFGSGVTAEWVVDQFGRLGLDKASGKPDQQDIQEFQMERQKLFS